MVLRPTHSAARRLRGLLRGSRWRSARGPGDYFLQKCSIFHSFILSLIHSFIHSFIHSLQSLQQQQDPPTISIGFYVDKGTITFKTTLAVHNSPLYGPQKLIFRPILTLLGEGGSMEITSKGDAIIGKIFFFQGPCHPGVSMSFWLC